MLSLFANISAWVRVSVVAMVLVLLREEISQEEMEGEKKGVIESVAAVAVEIGDKNFSFSITPTLIFLLGAIIS